MIRNKIINAIDEGLKLSLIDFGNNTILKTSNIDINFLIIDQIDNWYWNTDDPIPTKLYNILIKKDCIGIYLVDNDGQLKTIVEQLCESIGKTITNDTINLNWIDVSQTQSISFFNNLSRSNYLNVGLDILHWDLNIINQIMFSNTDLKQINLPDSIIAIGTGAFIGTNLEYITIPNGVEYIGKRSFAWCIHLKNIILPDSLKKIDDEAFYMCDNPQLSVTYLGTYKQWIQIDKGENIFHKTSRGKLQCNDGNIIKINQLK